MNELAWLIGSFLAVRLDFLVDVRIVAAFFWTRSVVDFRLLCGAGADVAYHALEPALLGGLTAQPAACASCDFARRSPEGLTPCRGLRVRPECGNGGLPHGVSCAAGVDDLEQTERDDPFVHHFVRDRLPFDVLMVVA